MRAQVNAGTAFQDLREEKACGEGKVKPGNEVHRALVVAMNREAASVRLYEGLAALGGPAKGLFSALADEEQRHKRLLEEEYDDLMGEN